MDSIFFSKNIERFFGVLDNDVADMGEAYRLVDTAISCIAEEYNIAAAEYTLSEPASILHRHGLSKCEMLYGNEEDRNSGYCENVYHTMGKGKVSISIYPVTGYEWTESERNVINNVCRQIHNICSRAAIIELIRRIQNIDTATGIPNIQAFMGYLGRTLYAGKLSEYEGFYFNIHNFKYVNKVLDYEQGTIVLQRYAHMVEDFLDKDEMLARLGGDNFVAIIRKDNSDRFLTFLQNIRLVHCHGGKEEEFRFGATVGAATLDSIKNPGEFMMNVSVAYQAARENDIVCQYYSPELFRKIMSQKEVIARFNAAVERREFVVYYQPKVKLDDRTLCGAEALVRWVQDGSIIPPASFIPVLEKEGAICRLDFYVLDYVCRFLSKSVEENGPVTKISVNFSRRHLNNERLVEDIVDTVDRYGIDHKYIEIELTESEDFNDYVLMEGIVEKLHENGISTAIDDFGSGYSSLNMLKRTGFDVIKIDKSFIPLEDDYPDKEKDMIMLRHIVGIAGDLGMCIVAEGVETEEQLKYLKELKCDIVQGYIFDRPLDEEAFSRRLLGGTY